VNIQDKMEKKNLNEDLERFNNLIGYNPSEGNVVVEAKTRRTYLQEEEPESEEAPAEEEEITGADFDFGDEGSPEGEEAPAEEAPAEEESTEDEFGTADEFTAADELEDEGEVEEIDVTAIVGKSEEAKDLAQKAVTVGEKNTEFLQSLTDKLSNLESSLSKMDTIATKINKLEQNVKTPEEKLELRSLDSYPFNVNLSDYWEEKANKDKNYRISSGEENSNGEQKEYVIKPEDIENFNDNDIEKSFSPESN
jgi:hypothetical protein